MRFRACSRRDYRYVSRQSGRSAAWLARPSGGREVESSNLSGPTNLKLTNMALITTKPPASAKERAASCFTPILRNQTRKAQA